MRYRPLGPVLAVMPWNFPLWQVIRFAAPALMAGNVGLLKHASNVPQTALYLEDLFRRAGYPEGCFQTLLIGSGAVEDILRDPRVKAATLTGSEPAGRAVASVAGDEVKKTVLELGGSDPYVVMPSADVDRAAQDSGDGPGAEQRTVMHRRQAVHRAHGRLRRLRRALHGGHEGPERWATRWTRTRTSARSPPNRAAATWRNWSTTPSRAARPSCAAANAPTGPAGTTRRPSSPTSPPRCASTCEEAFGPVATLYRAADLDEAVAIANDTPFGLSSNVWTRDEAEIDRFVRDLEAGGVYVNGMTASHPAFPFGGVKRSGYGRELSGHGIREFCNITTVWHGA